MSRERRLPRDYRRRTNSNESNSDPFVLTSPSSRKNENPSAETTPTSSRSRHRLTAEPDSSSVGSNSQSSRMSNFLEQRRSAMKAAQETSGEGGTHSQTSSSYTDAKNYRTQLSSNFHNVEHRQDEKDFDDDDQSEQGSEHFSSNFSLSTLGVGGASVAVSETKAASRAARADLERILFTTKEETSVSSWKEESTKESTSQGDSEPKRELKKSFSLPDYYSTEPRISPHQIRRVKSDRSVERNYSSPMQQHDNLHTVIESKTSDSRWAGLPSTNSSEMNSTASTGSSRKFGKKYLRPVNESDVSDESRWPSLSSMGSSERNSDRIISIGDEGRQDAPMDSREESMIVRSRTDTAENSPRASHRREARKGNNVREIMNRLNKLVDIDVDKKNDTRPTSPVNVREEADDISLQGSEQSSSSSFQREMSKFRRRWDFSLDDDDNEDTVPTSEEPHDHSKIKSNQSDSQLSENPDRSVIDKDSHDRGHKKSNQSEKFVERVEQDITSKGYVTEEAQSRIGKYRHTIQPTEPTSPCYKRELSEKDEAIASLENKLLSFEQMKKESNMLKTDIVNLENDLEEKNRKVLDFPSKSIDIQSLSEELENYKKHNELLDNENSDLRNDLKISTQKRNYLESSLKDVYSRVQNIEKEKASGEKDFHAQLEVRYGEYSALERTLSIKNHDITSLESEIDELAVKLEDTKLNMETALRKTNSEELANLSKQLNESKGSNTDLVAKISLLEDRLQEAEANISDTSSLSKVLRETETSITQLEKEKALLEENNTAIINNLKNDLLDVTNEKSEMATNLNDQISSLEKEKMVLQNELALSVDSRNSNISYLNNQLDKYEHTVASLKSSISEMSVSLGEKSKIIEKSEESIDIMSKEISQLRNIKEESEEKTKELNEKDKFIVSLKEDIKIIRGRSEDSFLEIQSFENTVGTMRKELSEKTNENKNLSKELKNIMSDARNFNDRIEHDRRSMKDKIFMLEEELKRREYTVASLKKTVVSLSEELRELALSMEGKLLMDEDEVDRLEDEVDSARRIIEQDHDIQHLVYEHKDLKKSTAALKELVSVLRDKLECAGENKVRSSELDLCVRNLKKELEMKDDEYSEKVKHLQDKIAKLKQQLNDTINRKESVEKKLRESSKLLSRAEAVMAKTNEATLNTVLEALQAKSDRKKA